MKYTIKVCVLAILSLALSLTGYTQKTFYIGKGDSLYNSIPAHRGTVQWMYTTGTDTTWKSFQDPNSKKNTFGISITADMKIRARVTEGYCDIFSDITTVYATVSDIDGNVYPLRKIGSQIWMTENLRTTHYNNGDTISYLTNATDWANYNAEAYCNVNNCSLDDSIKIYGRLYNWFAVNQGKLCPAGWHVPTVDEWSSLIYYLSSNGYNYDGSTSNSNVAKSLASPLYWSTSQTIGAPGNSDYPQVQNITRFSAIPVGLRWDKGQFNDFSISALWWSSTELNQTDAWFRLISKDYPSVTGMNNNKTYGLSVRCLKD
jgi:uncharacterized protein (TIGR02145 family)